MPQNLFVYLIGFAGTGKLTIARELAGPLAAKVVDNHWINNPIFGLLDNDRLMPFPDAVWDEVDRVRKAVLRTIATLAGPTANVILTQDLAGRDEEDWTIYEAVQATAGRRGSTFVPVRLLCTDEVLVRRVTSPDRAAHLKSMNADAARWTARNRQVLDPRYANTLTLDTSNLSAGASAQAIIRHIGLCLDQDRI